LEYVVAIAGGEFIKVDSDLPGMLLKTLGAPLVENTGSDDIRQLLFCGALGRTVGGQLTHLYHHRAPLSVTDIR
jgi:hypothetical protein